MGWWSTGRPGEITGDDVVDEIAAGFQFLEGMTGTKPDFQELLDPTAQMVQSDGGEFLLRCGLGPRQTHRGRVCAPRLVSRPDAPIDDLLFNVGGMFRRVAQHYMNTDFRRKPHLTELLDGLAFVLRVEPERVFAMPKACSSWSFACRSCKHDG
jgi:hypothetical protein